MKALVWHGKRDVRVDEVPDPDPGADRRDHQGDLDRDLQLRPHLYEVLGAYLTPGDILGHEPMGIVEEVGPTSPHQARRPRGHPVQHLLRPLLDV